MKVIYIAGYGRSGSTLLGTLLGQAPNACFVGELTQFWGAGLRRNQLCSCGKLFRDCPFWREVVESAFGDEQDEIVEPATSEKRILEHMRNLPRLLGPRLLSHAVSCI